MAVYYPSSWRSVALLLIFQFLHSFCLFLGHVSWALVVWITCLCHLPNPLQREWLKSVSGKLCLGINNTVRRQFDATSIYLNNKVKSPSPIVYDVPCDGLLSGFIVSVMDSFSVVSTLIQSKCRWLPLWIHPSRQVVIIVHDTNMTHSMLCPSRYKVRTTQHAEEPNVVMGGAGSHRIYSIVKDIDTC